MRYLIERASRTRFEAPVREHHVELRLVPWEHEWQRVPACTLTVEPPADPTSHRDGFGNLVHRFAVLAPHDHLRTTLRVEVESLLRNPFEFEPVAPGREREWIAHALREAPRLWDFVVHRSAHTPALPVAVSDVQVPVYEPAVPMMQQVQNAMGWIGDLCELDMFCEQPQPELSSLLATRCGGPPDFVHLLIAILRGWGVPARYAIGYVDAAYFAREDDAEAEPVPQAMHAWSEVLIPGAGWRGFDPALCLLADDTYVRVAVGRDADDVTAERAVYKGDNEDVEPLVDLKVSRLD